MSGRSVIWPKECDWSRQQTDPRLPSRLSAKIRFPPVFRVAKLLCFLQHSFSFVDPLRQDRHSAFEVAIIGSLHCPKLRLFLIQSCPPGESLAVSREA